MADLEATEMFGMIVDRLVDAERRASSTEAKFSDHASVVHALRRDLAEANSRITSQDSQLRSFRQAEEPISKLYDAVEAAIAVLGSGSQAAIDLKAAMIAAQKFFDPIPF